MKKIPIDIVLLPPDDVMNLCIELSRKAYERGENKLLRSKTNRLPHITIMMGCLHEEDEEELITILENELQNTKPFNLSVISQNSTGILDIEKTSELVELHKSLIKKINPIFKQDCEISDLLEEQLDENARIWVNNFMKVFANENFHPHITTHNKQKENIKLPINFIADRIAMCHMGDHGTCRKILWETKLK